MRSFYTISRPKFIVRPKNLFLLTFTSNLFSIFELSYSFFHHLRLTVYKLLSRIGVCQYAGTFHNIPYFTSTIGDLKNGAAIALPGLGIFIHPSEIQNMALLRHEYGHILQAKKWGKLYFYKSVAWTSLMSARKSNHQPSFNHQQTWTEWSANKLSYEFFNHPLDWPLNRYPISPPLQREERSMLPSGLTLS